MAKASRTASNPASQTSIEDQIRARAYELYEARGRVDGFHQQDWEQAEREVRQQQSRKAAA
jgi:Protein of unknown function (DUF2934)